MRGQSWLHAGNGMQLVRGQRQMTTDRGGTYSRCVSLDACILNITPAVAQIPVFNIFSQGCQVYYPPLDCF